MKYVERLMQATTLIDDLQSLLDRHEKEMMTWKQKCKEFHEQLSVSDLSDNEKTAILNHLLSCFKEIEDEL